MKATLRWLQEFADIPDDVDGVATALASLGHEVESVTAVVPQMEGVVVAKTLEVMAHPNADRIRLARVTTGVEESVVVCGAWNFAAGDVVALAPPGARLAGGLEVGTKEIRGITSPGMICSARELGLGEDHEGILVLHPGTEVGSDFAALLPLPDTVFDLSITTNRPDAMGVVGLARDLAAYYRVPLRLPEVTIAEVGPPSAVTVDIADPDGCGRFTAREVRNVAIGPSPLWMQVRLEAVGVRSINNVVDVSNYVMLELGHPTHTFDLDRLGTRVVIRRALSGERLTTLDGAERELLDSDVVVADAERAVALAGVMGGEDTEVHQATTDVLVEVAYFDPVAILLTSKRHGLRTEASARFERGMDPEMPPRANDRVTQLLAEVAGGEPAPALVDACPRVFAPRRLQFDPAEIKRIMALDLDAAQAADYLTRLGFTVADKEPMTVTVPTRRPDIERPVDLLEEVGRLHGYDQIPESIARGPGGGLPPWSQRTRSLRSAMAGAGYHETMTFPFLAPASLERLGLEEGDPRSRTVRLANPLLENLPLLRTTILPGLLEAAARNAGYGRKQVSLFEVGMVFSPSDGELPEQHETLAFVTTGRAGSWFADPHAADALDATGVWERLVAALDIGDTALTQADIAPFHPARAAAVSVADTTIGALGEIHPRVVEAYGLTGRVAAGEFSIAHLLEPPGPWQFRRPSEYPPLVFDVAFEIADDVPASSLSDVVARSAGELLERLEIFDVFSGEPLPEGRKSIAIRIMLRAPDRTLTDEEAAAVRGDIATAVGNELGGRLRADA